jgi:integrase
MTDAAVQRTTARRADQKPAEEEADFHRRLLAEGALRVDWFDDHPRDRQRGLVLRVSTRLGEDQSHVTSRTWAVLYRVKGSGKLRRLTIGDYPSYSLADARTEAEEATKSARRGIDPAEQRKAAAKAEAARSADTIEKVVDEFMTRHMAGKERSPRYIKETRRIFDSYVLPRWRGRAIGDITRRDIIELLDKVFDDGAPIAANRTLAAVRKLLNWALQRGLIEASPATLIERPGEEQQRDRTLAADEIRALWPQFDALGFPFGRFFQMALATGQRREEVAGMRWPEIKAIAAVATPADARMTPIEWTWTMQADRTKADRAHVVPLSPIATEILGNLPRLGAYVFTSTGARPISGYSKAKAALDKAVDVEQKKAGAKSLEHWTIHDLRRTAATEMARLGIARLIIGKVLNHADRTVTGIYDRHQYLAEKRRALEVWGQYLGGLVKPTTDDNVTRLHARAS